MSAGILIAQCCCPPAGCPCAPAISLHCVTDCYYDDENERMAWEGCCSGSWENNCHGDTEQCCGEITVESDPANIECHDPVRDSLDFCDPEHDGFRFPFSSSDATYTITICFPDVVLCELDEEPTKFGFGWVWIYRCGQWYEVYDRCVTIELPKSDEEGCSGGCALAIEAYYCEAQCFASLGDVDCEGET